MRNAVVIVLFVLVAFLAHRVAALENQRYALQVGMCERTSITCLDTVQTRTSWLWNFFYGITG